MAALIRQVRPVWAQMQAFDLEVPAHALRNTLLALGAGLLVMAGLALNLLWPRLRALLARSQTQAP